MERPPRSKEASMMSYFSKAATFTVSNPPHSPGRRLEKGFSGPIVSIIPKEARHKKRSNSGGGAEPSSPKISCMGQIKPKKKKGSWRERRREKAGNSKRPRRRLFCPCLNSFFRRRARTGGVPEKEAEEKAEKKWVSAVAPPPPGSRLSKMSRYKSGRETLGNFDWKKTADGNHVEEEEEKIFIPHSAPILMGAGAAPPQPAGLGKMRQYQSRREKLGDFDWRKTAPERDRDDEEEEEEEKICIPHSAPITAGGRAAPRPPSGLSKMTRYRSGHETLGDFDWTKVEDAENVPSGSPEPGKGLNLWRRRETAPPIPLQIKKN